MEQGGNIIWKCLYTYLNTGEVFNGRLVFLYFLKLSMENAFAVKLVFSYLLKLSMERYFAPRPRRRPRRKPGRGLVLRLAGGSCGRASFRRYSSFGGRGRGKGAAGERKDFGLAFASRFGDNTRVGKTSSLTTKFLGGTTPTWLLRQAPRKGGTNALRPVAA